MNALSRSWGLLKLSVRVIDQDREMLLFPLLAGLSSLAFLVAMIYPTFVAAGVSDEFGAVEAAVLFALYFGLAFIATFFNVCVVYTAKTRLEGGDATFGESLKFALGRSHRILAWSAVSASVGLLLRGLDTLAERAGGVGEALIHALSSLLGALWSIATIFVVPVLVYHDIGPFAAISRSVQTLKQTWGESLARHFGLGLLEFLFMLPGVGLAYLMFWLADDATMFWIALAVTVTYFLAVILFFSLANAVFNTALYVYAETKRVPAGYDEEVLVGAFLPRG